MDNYNWFIIKDFQKFINDTRAFVFTNFASNKDSEEYRFSEQLSMLEKEELDKVLTFSETENIAKGFLRKQSNNKTKEIRYLMSEDNFLKIVESLNTRMVSNLIRELVKKGLLETAFDTEVNDFVFWAKEDGDEQEKE